MDAPGKQGKPIDIDFQAFEREQCVAPIAGGLCFWILEKVNSKILDPHRSGEEPEVDVVDLCARTRLAFGRPRDRPLQREWECEAKYDQCGEAVERDPASTTDAFEETRELGAQSFRLRRLGKLGGQGGPRLLVTENDCGPVAARKIACLPRVCKARRRSAVCVLTRQNSVVAIDLRVVKGSSPSIDPANLEALDFALIA